MEGSEAAENALKCVLDAVLGESVAIICDDEKVEVGEVFGEGALKLGLWTRMIILKTDTVPRREVPPQLLEVLTSQKPDIYINILRGIREETPFRIKIIHLETRGGRSRLGHCPGVTLDMLTEGALALTVKEHGKMQEFTSRLMELLEGTIQVNITNPSGTNLSLSVENRPFFTDTKLNWKTMKWMNLPTGEIIVAPVENSLEGKLVCDAAVGGIGPLKTPLEITVKNGKAVEVYSEDAVTLKRVKDSLKTDFWSNVVGEFTFGINPKARFVQEFLETEKILGTVHVAFGNNQDMPGGRNSAKNHIDFLISKPTVRIKKRDGSQLTVLENGKFQNL